MPPARPRAAGATAANVRLLASHDDASDPSLNLTFLIFSYQMQCRARANEKRLFVSAAGACGGVREHCWCRLQENGDSVRGPVLLHAAAAVPADWPFV